MALTKCTTKVTNISELATRPNATDGLTDATFKALFDQSVSDIKTYINSVLTVEIDSKFLSIFPVGTILSNTTGTNPSTYIGGTWTAWGSGRVPTGVDTEQTEFNTVEKTGGEKSTTLVLNNLPAGILGVNTRNNDFAQELNGLATGGGFGWIGTNLTNNVAHNNLQPYITCYFWKRTA